MPVSLIQLPVASASTAANSSQNHTNKGKSLPGAATSEAEFCQRGEDEREHTSSSLIVARHCQDVRQHRDKLTSTATSEPLGGTCCCLGADSEEERIKRLLFSCGASFPCRLGADRLPSELPFLFVTSCNVYRAGE